MSFLPFNFASGVLSKTFFFNIVERKREVFNTQGLLFFPMRRRAATYRKFRGPGEEFPSNVVSGPCLVCNIIIVVNCKIIVNSFRLGQRWLTMAGYKNVPREFKHILKD